MIPTGMIATGIVPPGIVPPGTTPTDSKPPAGRAAMPGRSGAHHRAAGLGSEEDS